MLPSGQMPVDMPSLPRPVLRTGAADIPSPPETDLALLAARLQKESAQLHDLAVLIADLMRERVRVE